MTKWFITAEELREDNINEYDRVENIFRKNILNDYYYYLNPDSSLVKLEYSRVYTSDLTEDESKIQLSELPQETLDSIDEVMSKLLENGFVCAVRKEYIQVNWGKEEENDYDYSFGS